MGERPNLWDDYLSQYLKPLKRQPRTLYPTLDFYRVVKNLPAYKMAMNSRHNKVLINLIIPGGATVYCPWQWGMERTGLGVYANSNPHSRFLKMRATRAYVHSIVSRDPPYRYMNMAVSQYTGQFIYRVGEYVQPNYPFSRHYDECASGIHFFITPYEALTY